MCEKCCSFYIFSTMVNFSIYFGTRKDKTCCPVSFLCRDISNAICDLVLYLLSDGWNMSWIFDGTIPFLYLKIEVAMQASDLSGTGSQFIFLKWAASMWEPGGKSKQRRVHLFYAVWNLCFRYLLRSGNQECTRYQNGVGLSIVEFEQVNACWLNAKYVLAGIFVHL